MGATLVATALAKWSAITPDGAFRILIQMALTALDTASDGRPANLYFGGHDPLLNVLPARENTTLDSRERAVRRHVDTLVAMGAIERTNRARSGANQVYRLTLFKTPRAAERKADKRYAIDEPPVENMISQDLQQDTQSPAEQDNRSPAQQDTVNPLSRTPKVLPRNQEEPVEEKSKEQGVDLGPQLTAARARPPCPNPGCAKGFVIIPGDPPTIGRCDQCTPTADNVIPFPDRKAQ